mmetsp:Transcript_13056/g.23680  ORF Transcript_13056/g.23680 Transcript_13056/m.23680 type:complete len:97 (-) Transcript_13056:1855-2145(-)
MFQNIYSKIAGVDKININVELLFKELYEITQFHVTLVALHHCFQVLIRINRWHQVKFLYENVHDVGRNVGGHFGTKTDIFDAQMKQGQQNRGSLLL